MSLYSCEEHKKEYESDCIACEIAKHIDDLEAKVKELEAVIAECGCQGEWCGKSPTPRDSGLCAVCEYEKKHATKEMRDDN